jgi:hypothetical protein
MPTTPTPNRTPDGQIACAYGEPWLGPHPICRQKTAEACGVSIHRVPEADWSHLARPAKEEG